MYTQLPSDREKRFWTRVTGYLPPTGATPGWQSLSYDSARHWGRAYLRHFPDRVRRLWRHLLDAARHGRAWLIRIPTHPRRLLLWLRDGIVGALAWTGRLGSKGLDLLGAAEAWDFSGQLLKPRTRRLSPTERAEAQLVFGDAINYDKVRIDEHSLIARLGRRLLRYHGLGIVLGHTIHFNRPLQTAPGNGDMRWLIHELVHVLQCEVAGLQYIGEAVSAQLNEGYDYGGTAALDGKPLGQFNREQQGDIAADFYHRVVHGPDDPSPYLRAIADLRTRRL